MTDQTPPRPRLDGSPRTVPVPRAHCDREGCRAAFLPTKAWHRFCSKGVLAGQSQRGPRPRHTTARLRSALCGKIRPVQAQPDLLLPALPPDRGHHATPRPDDAPGISSSGACPTTAWCSPSKPRLTSSPTRTTLPGRGRRPG